MNDDLAEINELERLEPVAAAGHDLFVSYKSQNANVARKLAEGLISQGVRVWFAEYQVLLQNYEEFQAAIDAGIDGCRHGLAVTNDRWAASEHCRHEMRRLLERLPAPRILELRLPPEPGPHQVFPALVESPSVTVEQSLNEVLEALEGLTDLPVGSGPRHLPPDLPPCARVEWKDRVTGARLGLRLGPFEASNWLPSARLHLAAHFAGPVDGLPASLAVFVSPAALAIGRLSVSETGDHSDRQVYDAYRHYALERYIRPNGYGERGLHLFFHHGRSHLALTYTYPDPDDPATTRWERRYALVFEGPTNGQDGEVDLVFGVKLPTATGDAEALARFCRLTATFDAIATSLRYEPPKRLASPPTEPAELRHEALPFPLAAPGGGRLRAEHGREGLTLTFHGKLLGCSVRWMPADGPEPSAPPPPWEVVDRQTLGNGLALVEARTAKVSAREVAGLAGCATAAVFLPALVVAWLLAGSAWVALGLGLAAGAAIVLLFTATGPGVQFAFVLGGVEYQLRGPLAQRRQLRRAIEPVVGPDPVSMPEPEPVSRAELLLSRARRVCSDGRLGAWCWLVVGLVVGLTFVAVGLTWLVTGAGAIYTVKGPAPAPNALAARACGLCLIAVGGFLLLCAQAQLVGGPFGPPAGTKLSISLATLLLVAEVLVAGRAPSGPPTPAPIRASPTALVVLAAVGLGLGFVLARRARRSRED